jgi:hypothetical protein
MLIPVDYRKKEITQTGFFKEKNLVSVTFINEGGTGVQVFGIPLTETRPQMQFGEANCALRDREFEIQFTDPTDADNKVIAVYSFYKPSPNNTITEPPRAQFTGDSCNK